MQDLSSLLESLRQQRPVEWAPLPEFALYRDQVLPYIDRQVIRFAEGDGLTAGERVRVELLA